MSITHSYFILSDYEPMVTESFGERFNRLCAEAGLPSAQVALGKKLSCSGAFVNMVRNNRKKPAIEAGIKWSEILNCTVEYLYKGKESARDLSPKAIEIGRIYDSVEPQDKALMWQNAQLIARATANDNAEHVAHEEKELG